MLAWKWKENLKIVTNIQWFVAKLISSSTARIIVDHMTSDALVLSFLCSQTTYQCSWYNTVYSKKLVWIYFETIFTKKW